MSRSGRAAAGTRPSSGGVIWFAHVTRGFAALVIIWGHLVVEFRQQDLVSQVVGTKPIRDIPSNFTVAIYEWFHQFNIDVGNAAVGMFFLVSGFVIPFALERRTMGGFALRRFFRFYPTLWVAIGLSVLFVSLKAGVFPYDVGQIFTNGLLVSQYAGDLWVDPSYWTLPIEEVFYVTAAILAVRGLLKSRYGVLGAGVVLCALGTFLGRQPMPTAENPPDWVFWTRLWLGRNMIFVVFVLIGVALHHLYRGGWSRRDFLLISSVLLSLYAIGLHNGPFQKPFQPVDQANIYFNSYLLGLGVFLLAYLIGDRITHAKWADNLAAMSYPIYLLNTVCGWILMVVIIESTGNYYLALVLTTTAILAMAWLLHRFVEVPTMTFGRRVSDRERFYNAREMYPRRPRGQPAPEPAPEPGPAEPSPPPAPPGLEPAGGAAGS